MDKRERPYIYLIGGLYLKVVIHTKFLDISEASGSYPFLIPEQNNPNEDYLISYSVAEEIDIPAKSPSFSADSFDEVQMPFTWDVYNNDDNFSAIIRIDDDLNVELVRADFNLNEKYIKVVFKGREGLRPFKFDPFFQPFGPILLNYILHYSNGIMIHASGVKDSRNGYVFTAVSGTGKSTMAELWQKAGAKIINDDRLVIAPNGEKMIMTNTPMPYYQDIYKETEVTAIFLINQSPENYIKPLSKIEGITGVMANCIQFLYDKKMVEKHLRSITRIVEKCPVYELGFKPTMEIIEIVRNEFGV